MHLFQVYVGQSGCIFVMRTTISPGIKNTSKLQDHPKKSWRLTEGKVSPGRKGSYSFLHEDEINVTELTINKSKTKLADDPMD